MPRNQQGKSHYNYGLPLMFIHNGITYEKKFDGYYHSFPTNVARIKENRISVISQAEAEELIINSAYISTVLYLADKEHFYLKP